jgi:hypothetical protein
MSWTVRLRKWHAYIGLLIAPSVLFFALTGALQIFNLHEAHGTYTPAGLIVKLSAVHKDQVFETPHDHPAPNDGQPGAQAGGAPDEHAAHDEDDRIAASTLVLKWYFLLVALGLTLSTLLGVWMGTTQLRSKAIAWTLLLAGILLPICTFAL